MQSKKPFNTWRYFMGSAYSPNGDAFALKNNHRTSLGTSPTTKLCFLAGHFSLWNPFNTLRYFYLKHLLYLNPYLKNAR